MINKFFTKNQEWLDKWDDFLAHSERGLYNQFSGWIKAYTVYGFEYTFYLITNNDVIVGGCGIVIAKFLFFKFYIIPSGPVVSVGLEDEVEDIIVNLKRDAAIRGCCYFQISLPVLNNDESLYNYTLPVISNKSIYFSGNSGTKFKYIIPLLGKRLVHLQGKVYQDVFKNYSKNHQRNVIKAASNNLIFEYAKSETQVKEAYQCFEQNAKDKGYPLRSYTSIKETLLNYISKDNARIGCCYRNTKLVGAIYVMNCGNRFIYINGGVLKEYQQLNISHFLHDFIIKESLVLGYKSYDISVGGSQGVIKFKEGFGSELFEFIDTKHWILKPSIFTIYLLFENKLKKYKSIVANVLVKVKK